MKKTFIAAILAMTLVYMSGACTKLRTPSDPPEPTATPNEATATAIAQVTGTAIALLTAGPGAQQTATAEAAIILSHTKTTTPTFFASPTRTATVTATIYVEHGFRFKTITSYMDGVIMLSAVYSYATGCTPVSGTCDHYAFGAYSGHEDAVFDLAGNTVTSVIYNETGAVLWTKDGIVTGGLLTRANLRDSGGALLSYGTFQYDIQGRKIREEGFNASDVSQGYKTWQYNASGGMTREDIYNPGGIYNSGKEYIYNAAGAIIRENQYGPGGALGAYNTYTINAQGKQASGQIFSGTGSYLGPITFTYDSNWNCLAMTYFADYGGGVFMSLAVSYTYDPNNYPTSITMVTSSDLGGGVTTKTVKMDITWEAY